MIKSAFYFFRNVFRLLKRGYKLKHIFQCSWSEKVLTNGDLYFVDD